MKKASSFVPISSLGKPPLPKPEDGMPCHQCTARCCNYFALEIDKPTTPRDHDQIRWMLMHQHTVAWVLDGDWYLEVRTPCKHLLPDNRCAIYDSRPQLCRDYGRPDDPCEYFTDDAEYDLYFDTVEKFEAWSAVELTKRARRLRKRRERERERKAADALPKEAIA